MIYKLIISLFISLYPKNFFHLVIDGTYLFHSNKSYNKIKIIMLVFLLITLQKQINLSKNSRALSWWSSVAVNWKRNALCFSGVSISFSLRRLECWKGTLWLCFGPLYWGSTVLMLLEILLLRKAFLWFYKNI